MKEPNNKTKSSLFSGLIQDKGLFYNGNPASVIPFTGKMYNNLRNVTGRNGLIRGEMVVIGVASGGGKTVICNQLMVDAAMKGNHVLYVSSEMDAAQMRARFISYASWRLLMLWLYENGVEVSFDMNGIPLLPSNPPENCPYEAIPYDLLKVDGINEYNWTHEAIADDDRRTVRMLNTMNHVYDNYIRPYFHFVHISDIAGNWETCFDYLSDNTGHTPDLVCLDWLGGCADDLYPAQFDLRRSLSATANQVSSLAKEYSFAAVVTTQLSSESEGMKYPPISTFGECKSVKDRACAALTISSLGASDIVNKGRKKSGDTVNAIYDGGSGKLAIQGMNCGKSRYGNSGCFDVCRNFDYQCYALF